MKKDFKFKNFFKKKAAVPTLETTRAVFTVLTSAQIDTKKAGVKLGQSMLDQLHDKE